MNACCAPFVLFSFLAAASAAQLSHQWRSVDADKDSATFFDQSSLQRLGLNLNRAVFAIAWKTADDAIYPDFRIKNVSAVEEVWDGNCGMSNITLVRRTYYSDDGKQLEVVRASNPAPFVPKHDSQGMEVLNLLCGRPQLLGRTFEVGPAGLVEIVRNTKLSQKPRTEAPR